MISVNIRELTHHFADYLDEIKSGERIIIMERNKPVAEIIPHRPGVQLSWKRPIQKIRISGEPLSKTIIKNRREENR